MVSKRARGRGVLALLGASVLIAAAGCGGDDGDNVTAEDAMRDCLTEEGLTVEASDLGSSASLGSASPDFQVLSEKGEIADVIVEGSDEKASKTAADIKGAKQAFGAANAVVVKEQNAVVIFEDTPPADFRDGVLSCAQ